MPYIAPYFPWDTITIQLNADGVKTRYGGQWYGAPISKIARRGSH